MILNFKGDEYPKNIVRINDNLIENVKDFTYLGAVITYSEPSTSNKEIERRIGLAHSKFAEMKKLLCNYHLKLSIRMKFYNTFIRSRLCYCCETWTLTQRQYERVDTVHTQFLRRMIRGGMARMSSRKEIEEASKRSKEAGDNSTEEINWAWKLNNKKILTVSKAEKLSDFINKRNVNWVAHVVRSSNETLTKRLMFVDEKFTKVGYHHKTVLENVIKWQEDKGKSIETFLRECTSKKRNGGQTSL